MIWKERQELMLLLLQSWQNIIVKTYERKGIPMKKQTIYEQINSLARQMIQTNDEEKIKRCQKEICEMVFQHLTNVDVQRKQFSGSISKIRFRLLPEQVFDFEQFNEQLFLSLTKNAKGNWRFQPEKGAEYLTYLRFVIS